MPAPWEPLPPSLAHAPWEAPPPSRAEAQQRQEARRPRRGAGRETRETRTSAIRGFLVLRRNLNFAHGGISGIAARRSRRAEGAAAAAPGVHQEAVRSDVSSRIRVRS